jgi:spermidine synthase
MLVPTVAMGTTLAFGVRVLAHQETARALGTLYAANALGACLAPLVAEFHLIGALGLRGTALVAAGLNVLAATLALGRSPAAGPASAPPAARATFPARLLLAAALAGGLALALEVIWFRLLVLHAPGSDVTFALMLAVVLLGIAIGGALAPLLARLGFARVAAGGSLAVVAGYALTGLGQQGLMEYAACLILPAAVLSGSLFTLLGAELRADSHDPQPAVGILTTANTLGAALGAALAGLVLLPRAGIEASLFLLAAGYALLPLLAARPATVARPLAVAAAGLLLFPFGRMDLHLQAAAQPYRAIDGSAVARVTQGATTTLQLLRSERFGEAAAWRLLTDSYSMTAITSTSVRYMQMFGWLPLALHPQPQRALLISYGAGNTAQALLSGAELRQLTVVDVSPEILGASPLLHGEHDPLQDPRVRVVMEDGRHFLRTHAGQFDIITGEPPPPLIAGVVNLYTQEYFSALAARLAPGGLATYWLPVWQFEPEGARAVVHAFCNAFPDCTLWAGGRRDWILMGGREFRDRPGAGHFLRLWRGAAGSMLERSGLEHPEQLGAAFLGDAEQLRRWYAGTPALVDDFPKRMAPATAGAARPEYEAWLDPADASRRFRASGWVQAHWPAELVEASVPFFSAQPALNGGIASDPMGNVLQVDAVLRHSDLRIPVLWLLGSDVTEQEIVNRRLAAGGYQAAYAYPLAVRALAERDYATAARLFAQAAELEPRPAGALGAYSLCRAGLRAQAAAVPGAQQLPRELHCWRAESAQ